MADKDGRNMHFLKLIIKALINSGVINKAMYKISKKFTCSLQGIVVFCLSQNVPDPQQPLPTMERRECDRLKRPAPKYHHVFSANLCRIVTTELCMVSQKSVHI